MFSIQRFDRTFRFASVAFYVLLAAQYFRLWVFPSQGEGDEILTMSTLMAFEFVMVHSGVVMSAFSGSKRGVVGLIALYSIFAIAFNYAMPNNIILYTYLFAVLNRCRYVFYDSKGDGDAKGDLMTYSFFAVLIYFFLTITIVMLEGVIPPLGITSAYLQAEGYFDSLQASGLFVEKPYIGLALGTCYFSALAYLEVRLTRNSGKLRKSARTKSPVEIAPN